MRKEKKVPAKKVTVPESVEPVNFDAEEFAIVELEDRLELGGCCNNNCSCTKDP